VLDLDNVTVALGPAGQASTVLSGVTLHLGKGEALGLVGESGSGKSMTMRTILHTLPSPSTVTGRLTYEGDDVLALRGEALRRFGATRVSMISQNPQAALNPVLPVRKYLTEGILAARRDFRKDQALDLSRSMLDQVGIQDVDSWCG